MAPLDPLYLGPCRVLKFGTAYEFLILEFSYLNGRSLEMSRAYLF